MDNPNPYQAPRADLGPNPSAEAPPSPIHGCLFTGFRIVIGLASAVFMGFVTWLAMIIVFFGKSTAYWPGWACLVPAVLVAGFMFWLVGFSQIGVRNSKPRQ